MQELELSIACVCHWRVVNGSSCRGVASPLLVEHIADVQHIEGQLNRMDFLAHLELVGLGEMEVEVTLKRLIVGKTLVVLATVLAQITVTCNPLLVIGPLLVGSISGCGLELHLVNLRISRDEHQVVSIGTVAVQIAIVVKAVRRTRVACIDQADSRVPMLGVILVIKS